MTRLKREIEKKTSSGKTNTNSNMSQRTWGLATRLEKTRVNKGKKK